MEKRLKNKGSILVLMLAGMLFLFSCIGPIDDGFDHRNSGYKTLVINEIVAAPADGGADWIELYNAGGSYVYLRDYALVDNDTEREPVFLPDITLGPGEFYVVQAGAGTTDDGSFYLSFGLGSSDSLFLFWGLIVVDELAWKSGDAPSGYSFGRFPDGTGPACTLIPTRYGKNREMIKSSLLINEIVATPAGGGMDWIELYNSGEDPMYLEDYSIVDDNPLHEPVNLPDVILGPGEFFVILATSIDSGDGSFFMPYGLNPSDSVTIYKGADIMDVLDWDDGDAPEGYSFGRLPDGASNCQTLIPTPGEPNQGV